MKITEDSINHNIIRLIKEQDIPTWLYGHDTEDDISDAFKVLAYIEGMTALGDALKEVIKQ